MSFVIKQGDTRPSLLVELRDKDGAVDLTNAVKVEFHMAMLDGGEVVIDSEADNLQVSATEQRGYVSYPWAPGETATPGRYYGEFEVTFVAGEVMTFPNDGHNPLIIKIVKEIA